MSTKKSVIPSSVEPNETNLGTCKAKTKESSMSKDILNRHLHIREMGKTLTELLQ